MAPEAVAGQALRRVLLCPSSVALVGASDDPSRTTARPLQYLRRIGFPGRVFPINPNRAQVLGERAWPSLAALPERPEHVYILTPADLALEAVEECGRLGIPIATVLADGFASGAEAEARRIRLRDACDRFGIRVIGPSCLGVVDLRERLVLTANAAYAEPDLPVGRIFAASHSGSVIGALVSRGKARGIGFAGLVSVGNEVDLSLGEICAATLDDPEIDGYLLFLETLRHADWLRQFALGAAERGKPVIAYKLGRSPQARELALSHTGAIAGEDDVASAFLADCGIARVQTFDALLEAFPLLRRVPLQAVRKRPTAAVVTTTGGVAAMLVDQLALRGIEVVEPTPALLDRLRTRTGIAIEPARVVDLTLAGTRYDMMKAALDTLLADPGYDLVVAVVGSSARFQPELAVQPIIDSAVTRKPLIAFLAPEAPDALLKLAEAGVPSFRTPESCADAAAAAWGRRLPRRAVRRTRVARATLRTLDEAEGYALLARLGILHAPFVVLDVPFAAEPKLPFDYPVAVKALSEKITHKTDTGGVQLDILDSAELREASGRLREQVARKAPDVRLDRVLVQQMQRGVAEVLLGYRVDPEVGPFVLLAPGGVLAELAGERAIRLAPITADDAREMIAELRALEALRGFRGKDPGDLDALADAIAKLSQLAADATIAEAEINPLIVRGRGEGVVAVDVLVRAAAL